MDFFDFQNKVKESISNTCLQSNLSMSDIKIRFFPGRNLQISIHYFELINRGITPDSFSKNLLDALNNFGYVAESKKFSGLHKSTYDFVYIYQEK